MEVKNMKVCVALARSFLFFFFFLGGAEFASGVVEIVGFGGGWNLEVRTACYLSL